MYSNFAPLYDKLMFNADYSGRTKYLLSLFEKFDRKPTLLLDLACGTGGFSNEFCKAGISVIGVDISPDMLSVARVNSSRCKADVLYLCQDAAELDLYGTVDGAVCCFDSLNHITEYDKLKTVFLRVSLFLEQDRLFIFDVNTVFKHETVLGNNTLAIERNGIYCVWNNEYDEETKTTDISLDFFVEQHDGTYERFSEEFCERAYSENELAEAIKDAGLKTVAIFAENTTETPKSDTQRLIYVTRKV